MNPAQIIALICWGIFLLYWLSKWNDVKSTEKQTWSTGNVRWVLLAILVIFVIINHFKLFFFRVPNFFASFPLVQIMSGICTIGGVSIAVIARRTLSSNWSGNVELKKNHELITTGIYHYVRHPIYTGVLLLEIGTLLVFPSLTSIFALVWISYLFTIKMIEEEKLLTTHFPKEYPAYKKRVKALIPFLF